MPTGRWGQRHQSENGGNRGALCRGGKRRKIRSWKNNRDDECPERTVKVAGPMVSEDPDGHICEEKRCQKGSQRVNSVLRGGNFGSEDQMGGGTHGGKRGGIFNGRNKRKN